LKSIFISVNSRLGLFDTPEVEKMTASDDIDIASIGKRKTALFVVVSDTDRSLDGLVNIFFTQAMNELCRVADKECDDSRLPVPVKKVLNMPVETNWIFRRGQAPVNSSNFDLEQLLREKNLVFNCRDAR